MCGQSWVAYQDSDILPLAFGSAVFSILHGLKWNVSKVQSTLPRLLLIAKGRYLKVEVAQDYRVSCC